MPKIELSLCPQCGARFQRTRYWHKFCSTPCRINFHREQREKALRIAHDYGLMQDPHSWQGHSPIKQEK